ncbi:MAG TPA: ATP-binding protein [Rhodocyclaceae bacterium]|uniref:sensor histidine kinase n=1 Tax=Accumulibacter sp. TaxID=2053492 RepID=UPI002CC5793E|nr:ATP-binding protein [Accumulibacter sp.]HNM82798.1 ATP-binding protein [Rhodocyclaceae bacterium]
MTGGIFARWGRRASQSLALRMALVMGGVATATAAFLAGLSFVVAQRLITENERISLNFQAEVVARQLEFESRALDRMLKTMASNAFISNALVDSLGRDQYLIPYLRDQEIPGAWRGELWLVDFEGQPIAANAPGLSFKHRGSPALRAVLAGSRFEIELAGDDSLLLAVPVVFPPTGSIEGAVVAIAGYGRLIEGAAMLVAHGTCLSVHLGERQIALPSSSGCADAQPKSPAVSRPLALPNSFRPLDAHLRVYDSSEAASMAARNLTFGYLLVVGTVIALVLLVSHRMSGHIVRPLTRLKDTANNILRSDRLDFRAPVSSADEIGQLASTFNQMVERLQRAQATLITDIDQRKRVEAELQRYRKHLEEMVTKRTQQVQQINGELRQAMNHLVQAEKLAALGNLVAGVAHELSTPLGNTRILVGLLADQLRDFATTVEAGNLRRSQVEAFLNNTREATALLERNSARAAEMIGHFKQVAVDQSSARRRTFDLRETTLEILTALRPMLKRSAHRLEPDIPAALCFDSYPGPLEQVLTNLVHNSLTHAFSGIVEGEIHISARAVDPMHVVLTYTDNGVGIPAGHIQRVFDPFFTTRMGQGGSGLGLYIVYNLVTGVLGGTIAVDSSPPMPGTRFTLHLPTTAPKFPYPPDETGNRSD